MYLQTEMEEEYGAEFSLTLNDLVAKFVQTVEDYLPVPVIEEISSSEQYLSPTDDCSPAVSKLLSVLEVSNGNPSTADLTELVHELETVSTTRTRKQNCLPSRNQAKLSSTFKSPQTKENTIKTDRTSPIIPQGDCVEDSAKQQSTSTGSSVSQTTECSGITRTTLSDSSDVEIVEVSSEPNSECSPRGKKATRLQKETDTRNVRRVKTSLHNKSSVCTKAKGLDAGNSTTKGKELKKVKAKSPLSWNSWENTLRNDLIGSKSRGNKLITDFKSFSKDKQDMKVTTDDSDDETQCSKESSSGRNSVNDDKVGAEKRPVLRSDQDHIASPLVITLDSSIDSDTSITSPLLLANLEEQSLWKMKRQREEEQLSTEHSRKKRRKLEFPEKSSSDNQGSEADLQETSKVDKVQLQGSIQHQERESTTEEVANQASCSGKPATEDKANKSEDEDTNAEGASSNQVSAEGHSIEVLEETAKEPTSPCSIVGLQDGTQPFSPVLQEATHREFNSTTIADKTDAITTSQTKDEESHIRKGGAKALTEVLRPPQDADRLRLARSITSSVEVQDFPVTTVDKAPLANADEHISASPRNRKLQRTENLARRTQMLQALLLMERIRLVKY
ncbi:uncharacterized protein LOC118417537 [Branchiostoma floridae]|uniref:Uncharacterized protein LOC118417537 n=1 Tax=Branchiostoma floridae TaxID=7739 RepID=A0A9J7LAD7_BRAFL|nr:uncharacterized protein LOC118417537 [Branchiostoma floridae]